MERLGDRGLVVADVRWSPDRPAIDAYRQGHIPTAVFVDTNTDLSAPRGASGGRHPLPTPARFAAAMGRLGIGDDTAVVAYDDAGGSIAARLWWMLRVTGHRAAVLDGGLRAWQGQVATGHDEPRAPAEFHPRPWPAQAVVDAEAVDRLRTDPRALVLDARASERYRGEVEPIDAVAGHIPGAVNAPWAENLDPATGRFLDAAELRRRYQELGVRPGIEVVAQCGSGVTACHALLAMDVAGFDIARLYVGSWSDWISDPSRPVARDAGDPATDEGSFQR